MSKDWELELVRIGWDQEPFPQKPCQAYLEDKLHKTKHLQVAD
jgi:hypothetical protein